MQMLTAPRPTLSMKMHLERPAPGTCRLLLSDYDRFAEVSFCDRNVPRILQTISDEARAFQVNRILFKECSAHLFYSKPYLAWYARVLSHVYSDSDHCTNILRLSELNRSFALRILSLDPAPDNHGVHITLLLPPLWHCRERSTRDNSAEAFTMPDFRDASSTGLCLMRPVGSGHWMGKLLLDEHADGFRRVFSPEAVL